MLTAIKCEKKDKTFEVEPQNFFKCPFCGLSLTFVGGKLVGHGRSEESIGHAVIK